MSTASAVTQPARTSVPVRAWITLAVVAGGLFLAVVNTTMVSVALPTIGTDLHATASGLEWGWTPT